MRRFFVRFSESEASNDTPSLADFTSTTPELKFSVHTARRRNAVPRLKHKSGALKRKGRLGSINQAIREALLFQLCRDTRLHADARRRFRFDLARRSAHDISVPWQKRYFRRFRLLILVGLAAASAILPASAQQEATKLKVMATFSILGDFARNVGGDRVDVTTLVGPNVTSMSTSRR